MNNYNSLISEFLNVYWLRPENAIFSANLADSINRNFTSHEEDKILEVGLGDGIFSFTTWGGELDKTFDVYSTTKRLTFGNYSDDIYDSYDKDTYQPVITRKASLKIDLGYDIKQNLINKASKLHLYNKLEVKDMEDVLDDDKFDKILLFSAIIHLANPLKVVSNLKNMLADEGEIYINTMSLGMTRLYSLLANSYNDEFVKFIERDMRNLWPSLYTVNNWKKLFVEAGLSIKRVETVISEEYAPVWNIGMRPFSSQNISLYMIAKKYETEEANNIKQEYIDIVLSFAESFKVDGSMNDNAGGHLFVLEKA